jgi:hypothetical protein
LGSQIRRVDAQGAAGQVKHFLLLLAFNAVCHNHLPHSQNDGRAVFVGDYDLHGLREIRTFGRVRLNLLGLRADLGGGDHRNIIAVRQNLIYFYDLFESIVVVGLGDPQI